MPRNRIIYQSEVLYAGPSPATGSQWNVGSNTYNTKQLHRIQSANCGSNVSLKDVNQFGELAAIDRVIVESPTVNLDFSYLQQSFYNEYVLGFFVNSGTSASAASCIRDILAKTQDERNYWIKIVREGEDADANSTNTLNSSPFQFIGIGNGFISSYRAEGSVGNFPTVSVSVEALNMNINNSLGSNAVIGATFGTGIPFNGTSGSVVYTPAVNPVDGTKFTGYAALPCATSNPWMSGDNADGSVTLSAVSVLRPGDVTIDIFDTSTTNTMSDMGVSITDAKIQSYNLGFNLSRETLQKLGNKFAFAREIQFPVQVTMSVEANVGDLATGNLSDMITANKSYDLAVKLKHPTLTSTQVRYDLKGAKLDSQNFSSSIGPNANATLNFSAQIGGPSQTTVGLFMSGVVF